MTSVLASEPATDPRRRPVAQAAERVQAVVIGGGVVGCAVLRVLALRGMDALLLESEADIGEGASKANSAIVHTGFDATPGTVEARLLRRSAELWPELLDDLGVPFLQVGALMLARTAEERGRLRDEIATRASGLGVATELLDATEVRRAAPYVTPDAVAALSIPDEGVIDPFWLTRAYAEAALARGASVRTGARVVAVEVLSDRVEIELADGSRIAADQAFDCGGVRADEIARLAGDTSFAIRPRKGQFLVSERTYGVDRIVLPIPGPLGKGMLVTPIVFGGVLLGPTAEDGDDKADRSTDAPARQRILDACRGLVPEVEAMEPIRSFAGVRSVSSTGDYIIRPATTSDRFTVVAGIRSTGISASPAIAEMAVQIAADARGWSSAVVPARATDARPELAAEAGPIVCVCRSIGAAEVAAALAGPTPVATADALKRRCGAGFGDCQGNGCLAEVVERIALARGVEPAAIEKGIAGSWIVAGPIPAELAAAESVDRAEIASTRPASKSHLAGGRVDVAIVGGGLAGIGAALAARESGRSVMVVDRARRPGGAMAGIPIAWWTDDEVSALERIRERIGLGEIKWLAKTTVVGLARLGDDGWQLDLQGHKGAMSVDAAAVILATGGYITPRDHVAIDGPRPSGVMTADFAIDALDRGWQPARRVVIAGDGRFARGVAQRLSDAGVIVVDQLGAGGGLTRLEAPEGEAPEGQEISTRIRAVRGESRLEAVSIDDRWIPADGLILAHALRPAAFLLRGLGIGDDRPGVPMPVDATGALPLPGLWATGTCVEPNVDHARSLAAGRELGATVAVSLTPGSVAPS